MRVLVTGGSGFIGSHCVAALIRRGHEVRLLLRNPEKIARALDPLGIPAPEHVVGEVCDRASVRAAMRGCDAALHAAGLFSDDRRRAEEIHATNVVGTESVLEEAVAARLDPVVYVSSFIAVFPPVGSVLSAEDPVREHRLAYPRSKSAAERIARRFQESGAPIVSVYPGNVQGPEDPTLGQNAQNLSRFLKQGFVLVTEGGLPDVDVRDVAELCARAIEPGRGPRRYLLGGPFVTNAELADILCRLTGRSLRRITVPGPVLRGLGRLGDFARRFLGLNPQLSYEAAMFLTRSVPSDDSRAARQLGVVPRPAEESLRDMLRWMFEVGALEAADVGDLARA